MSSLHWSFSFFLCRFSSDYTSPFHLRHSYLFRTFQKERGPATYQLRLSLCAGQIRPQVSTFKRTMVQFSTTLTFCFRRMYFRLYLRQRSEILFVHFACVYLHNGADSIIQVGSDSLSSFYIFKFVTTNTFNFHDSIP